MKVALCQYNGYVGKCEENLKIIENLVGRESGSDVYCFPELFMNGYFADLETVKETSLTMSKLTDLLKPIALKYNIILVVGYAERENDLFYNSSLLIGPGAKTNYRKTHLYDPFLTHEKLIYSYGTELPEIVTIKGVKCSLLICFDIESPELARSLALMGCQCFFIITANKSSLVNDITVRSRALENSAFAIYVNRCGWDATGNVQFCGSSVAYAPNGDVLITNGESEGIKIAHVDPDQRNYSEYISRNPLLQERNPLLYSIISTPSD